MSTPADPRNPRMNLRTGDSRTAFMCQTSFTVATLSPTAVASYLIRPPPSYTSTIRKGYPDRKLLACPFSRTANQHPSPEYQGASQRHLRCSRQLIATAFVQNRVPLKGYQMVGAFPNCGGFHHGPCWICVPFSFGEILCSRGCRFACSEFSDSTAGDFCSMVERECLTHSFSACSVFSRKSARTCNSSLVVQVTQVLVDHPDNDLASGSARRTILDG